MYRFVFNNTYILHFTGMETILLFIDTKQAPANFFHCIIYMTPTYKPQMFGHNCLSRMVYRPSEGHRMMASSLLFLWKKSIRRTYRLPDLMDSTRILRPMALRMVPHITTGDPSKPSVIIMTCYSFQV